MGNNEELGTAELTQEAMLVVELTKALFKNDIDEMFRILERHLDKHGLRISEDVFEEYQIAGRIS